MMSKVLAMNERYLVTSKDLLMKTMKLFSVTLYNAMTMTKFETFKRSLDNGHQYYNAIFMN